MLKSSIFDFQNLFCMKILYTLTIILTLPCTVSVAQIFYTQYFDGADTIYNNSVNIELDTSGSNVWQIGAPQKIIFDSAATIPNVIVTDTVNPYPVNNQSIFTAKMYNQFFPWGILALQWKQKLDIDMDFDGAIVEFSIDSGATWQNAFNNSYVYNFYGYMQSNLDTLLSTGEYTFSGTDSSWRDIWLCFDLSWMTFNPDTMFFRFTLKSDSVDNGKEGWMIDNLMAHHTAIHTVNETTRSEYLNVYPNPSKNIIHIETQKRMEFHIIERMQLINSYGMVVEEWKNIPTRFWFETKKYSEGLYFLRIKTNIQSETVPVMVSRQ